MTPRIAGTAVSLSLVAVALAAAIIGSGYGVIGDDGRIAGGFLPVVTATVVVITGIIDARNRLADKSDANNKVPDDSLDIFGRNQKTRDRQLVVVLLLVLGGLLLVDVLGFLGAFAVLIFVVSFFVEKKKPIPTIAITGFTILAAYLIFDVFLEVPLPLGIFGR